MPILNEPGVGTIDEVGVFTSIEHTLRLELCLGLSITLAHYPRPRSIARGRSATDLVSLYKGLEAAFTGEEKGSCEACP